MLNVQQFKNMLQLQDDMNSHINPDWLTSNNDWMLAAMMEAVEAIDHHGWKWWKKQEMDLPQLQMELIDIWHFAMSHMLIRHGGNHHIVALDAEFTVRNMQPNSTNNLFKNLQRMVQEYAVGIFDMRLFFTALAQADLTTEDLYKKYIGKNALNTLRADNGYKEGSYIKIWEGAEDNVHLEKLLGDLDAEDDNFYHHVQAGLIDKYHSLFLA